MTALHFIEMATKLQLTLSQFLLLTQAVKFHEILQTKNFKTFAACWIQNIQFSKENVKTTL